MQLRYYLVLLVLGIVFVVLVLVMKIFPSVTTLVPPIANLGAAFAAVATAIIALGIANKPKPKQVVDFEVKVRIDPTGVVTHGPEGLPLNEIKQLIDLGFGVCTSYQVYFEIINISGYTLTNPTVTFDLRNQWRHPHRTEKGQWIPYYRSNLYNVQRDLRYFEYEEHTVLSNTVLPYLNQGQKLPIWIRMLFPDREQNQSMEVSVSLNCDNAEGKTMLVVIPYEDLIREVEEGRASAEVS